MSTDVAKITDEVYMEVVVGGEDPGNPQRTLDNASLSKDFMPVAWAAAYSKSKTYTSYSKVALCSVSISTNKIHGYQFSTLKVLLAMSHVF